MLEAVCKHPAHKDRLYVSDTVIRSLPYFANGTVFAMRAPAGTTIQLAEPDGRQFS
jgi:transcription factor E2F3